MNGVGNYSSYGIRNMIGREDGLYLGMANPMNLLTDPFDEKPEGGWELIRLTRFLKELDVALGGNGDGSVTSDPSGIDCGLTCTAAYDYGIRVVLTPTAATGSSFTGWEGECLGIAPCTVHLWESSTVTANFTLNQYALTVGVAGDGSGLVFSQPSGITCSEPLCSADFDQDTQVDLSAIAFSGSSFAGWSGACRGLDACEVTIGSGGNVVTATFADTPQTVNLEIDGPPVVGQSLIFTATLNMNPITTCTWDFGDGETEPCDLPAASAGVDATHDTVIQTTHAYTRTGVFVVIVTASNGTSSAIAAQQISIQTPTAETPTQQPGRAEIYFPFLNRD